MAPANQTKERLVHELFAGHSGTKVQCESCLLSQGKKHQNSQKWAKFMNFSFWAFFWFGLPGRLLRGVPRWWCILFFFPCCLTVVSKPCTRFPTKQRLPRSNKGCFLNDVFQSGVPRGWSGSVSAEDSKMLGKDWCFRAFFVPLKRFASVASRGEESEKHRLKNTVSDPWGLNRVKINAHSSTPTPMFLTSREETQTMVREKLGPKSRPSLTLYLPGKGETQTMV